MGTLDDNLFTGSFWNMVCVCVYGGEKGRGKQKGGQIDRHILCVQECAFYPQCHCSDLLYLT